MKDGFNLKTLFPVSDGERSQEYTEIGDVIILSIFTIFVCIVGLVGNGNIIWLLGFRIKRKPFAIYLLNMAVADFGSLVSLLLCSTYYPLLVFNISYLPPIVVVSLLSFFILMYGSCQLLLTAISTDRCVSVLFPNWYRCHRSPVLSTTVCASLWAIAFVLLGVPLIQSLTPLIPGSPATTIVLEYAVSTVICLLTVTIFTLTLLIKSCSKSQPCLPRNLLKVVLLIILSFCLFTILSVVCLFTVSFQKLWYVGLWSSLKSSIKPLIYFLAGRQKGGKFQERMKVIFQRLFKEERDPRMERQPHTQTVL